MLGYWYSPPGVPGSLQHRPSPRALPPWTKRMVIFWPKSWLYGRWQKMGVLSSSAAMGPALAVTTPGTNYEERAKGLN